MYCLPGAKRAGTAHKGSPALGLLVGKAQQNETTHLCAYLMRHGCAKVVALAASLTPLPDPGAQVRSPGVQAQTSRTKGAQRARGLSDCFT